MSGYDDIVCCQGTISVHDVSVCFQGVMSLYAVTAWCNGTIPLHDLSVSNEGVKVWCHLMLLGHHVTFAVRTCHFMMSGNHDMCAVRALISVYAVRTSCHCIYCQGMSSMLSDHHISVWRQNTMPVHVFWVWLICLLSEHCVSTMPVYAFRAPCQSDMMSVYDMRVSCQCICCLGII